jgi:large subunit ribosomal protein L10
MAKSRQVKEQTLTAVQKKFATMKAVVFTHYQGLTVKEVTELRNQLRQADVELMVIKKTLLRRVLKEANYDPTIVEQLPGSVALTFGYTDEVLPAKLLYTFGRTHEPIKLVGGIVDGKFLAAEQVNVLAKLPNREELITQTIWTIKAPLTGLVNVLGGTLRSLINLLIALKDKQPVTAA